MEAVRPYDSIKAYSIAALWEFSMLSTESWVEFIDWCCKGESIINKMTVWQILRLLRRKMYVTIHIMHPENDRVHQSKSMLQSLLPVPVKLLPQSQKRPLITSCTPCRTTVRSHGH